MRPNDRDQHRFKPYSLPRQRAVSDTTAFTHQQHTDLTMSNARGAEACSCVLNPTGWRVTSNLQQNIGEAIAMLESLPEHLRGQCDILRGLHDLQGAVQYVRSRTPFLYFY